VGFRPRHLTAMGVGVQGISIRQRNVLTFHKASKRYINSVLKVSSYLKKRNLRLYYKDKEINDI